MNDFVLEVPEFARLTDYVGAWAIEPNAARLLATVAKETDLPKHVSETVISPRAEVQMLTAGLNQKIAVVHLTGTLMKAASSLGGGTSTVAARREIRKAASDPDVSAIMLAIDSPGGTVAGTADLGAEIAAANKKKPVWAYAADLCASAAYWCASQAEKVFANDRTAAVGSIGTLLVVYDQSQALENAGVKTLVFGTGPIKGAGTPGAPITDDQKAYFREIVQQSQLSFDAAVKRGRDMTDAKLEKAKTGGVFLAEDAQAMGLIDGIKSFDAVMTDLAAEARRRMRAMNSTTRATAHETGGRTMNENTVATVEADIKAASDLAREEAIRTARVEAAADLERIAAIRAVTAGNEAIAAQAIREGWTAEKAENAVLRSKLSSVTAMNPAHAGPTIISRSHERDCTADVLAAGLMVRCGQQLDNPNFAKQDARMANLPAFLTANINADERNRVMDAAHRYRGLSLVDICREAIRLDGHDVPMNRDEMLKAAFSGGTLTNIFTTNVNASLVAAYLQATDTTLGWTQTEDVSDFKTQEKIRLETTGGSMKKLPRGGEADHTSRADKLESYKVARYAEQFVVDEQDMIDDAVNAIATTPSQMALKAARIRPDLVYSIILSNPTLNATSRALFNTTDGNLGSSSALASSTLKTAVSAFMLIQENSVNLNLSPTHLIVPPSLLWTSKELMTSSQIVLAGTAGSVTERGSANVIADANLMIVADARLENGVVDPDSGTTNSGSATTWYLASTMAQTIIVGYRGGRVPTSRSFTLDKGMYGMGWDIKLDIGAKAMDWRGLRKTTA